MNEPGAERRQTMLAAAAHLGQRPQSSAAGDSRLRPATVVCDPAVVVRGSRRMLGAAIPAR